LSALASASAPASPIWFPEGKLTHYRAPVTRSQQNNNRLDCHKYTAVEDEPSRFIVVRERLDASAMASACAPAAPTWLPATAFSRESHALLQHTVTTDVVNNAPPRSSVDRVRLACSALASARAPTSPIWLSVAAPSQDHVASATDRNTQHQLLPPKKKPAVNVRTVEIHRRQGSVGLQRLGQRLRTRVANLVACAPHPFSASPRTPSPDAKQTQPSEQRTITAVRVTHSKDIAPRACG
jgi:hypothetical protein